MPRNDAAPLPDLLGCAILILNDACPPEPCMQLCRMLEDPSGECEECWSRYLYYVASGRTKDPYAADRAHECGVIGP